MIEEMEIKKIWEQEELTVMVEGRLNTATAPRLEEALRDSMAGVNSLILDFGGLEYISSAGLRVLLWAHKTMLQQKGSMVVHGANEEVREVFTITGFAEILTVED